MDYILDENHQSVPCKDSMVFSGWMFGSGSMERRLVAKDRIGKAWISTVFLGIDHNHTDYGRPILFETLGVSSFLDDDEICVRYETWDEAVAGHKVVLAKIKQLDADLTEIARDGDS